MTRTRILEIAQTRGTAAALKAATFCQDKHLIAAVQELIASEKRKQQADIKKRTGCRQPVAVYKKGARKPVFARYVEGAQGKVVWGGAYSGDALAHLQMMRIQQQHIVGSI